MDVRSEGNYHETTLLVQNIRYMPRLQLDRSALWVSWGNKIWCRITTLHFFITYAWAQ